MEDVDKFLAGLQAQASSRFFNGLSNSGASGLGCNSRGFETLIAGHDDRETLSSGLFGLKQIRKLVKCTSKVEDYCFFYKDRDEWFDDLSGVREIEEDGRGRVRGRRVDCLYSEEEEEEEVEDICGSTMEGPLAGFPDELLELAKDDGSRDMKTVTEDEMFGEAVLEKCSSSFPQEHASVNLHVPIGGAGTNLRCNAGEEFLTANVHKEQGPQVDGCGVSSHSEKNEADNSGKDFRHHIFFNPEPKEVCVEDSKVVLNKSVIIINDDDDSDDDEHNHSSVELDNMDEVSIESEGESSSPSILQCDSWKSVDCSYSDDDCLVVEQSSSRKDKQQRPKKHNHENAKNVRRDLVDDSSDCEIMVGSQDEIRMHWEDAAMRKRLCKPMQSKGSGVGRADSSLPCSSSLRKGDKLFGTDGDTSSHCQESELESPTTMSLDLAESIATSDSSTSSSKREVSSCRDRVLQPESIVDTSEDWLELDRTTWWRTSPSSGSGYLGTQAVKFANQSMPGHENAEEGGIIHFAKSCDRHNQNHSETMGNTASDYRDGEADVAVESRELVGDREKFKETVEFKKAEEGEWALRQLELERQALEAQRMRKRKRAEADRKLEMEIRQKQRLEEIRETRQMEKKNLGLKEHFRGEVRAELEHKSLGCIDMASLLRRLGVSVDGGAFPTPEQVNAAYKRAILRFHPDRAAAFDHSGPRHQVEAEETFKLISRMKSLLPHVASQHLNSHRNGFH